jgi:hypothetical protein
MSVTTTQMEMRIIELELANLVLKKALEDTDMEVANLKLMLLGCKVKIREQEIEILRSQEAKGVSECLTNFS